MFSPLDYRTIEIIEEEYNASSLPWSLGYSGGKDSSALLKLVVNALLNVKHPKKNVSVIYCDTGVEIPIITEYVRNTFAAFKEEIQSLKLPIFPEIVEPKIENRFFVKVIGLGYPTPTNKFRWCTDILRIKPIQNQLKNRINNVVLIGVRRGESIERDKIIYSNHTDHPYYLNQVNFPNVKIFAPILDYNVEDIWSILRSHKKPESINSPKLEMIYTQAGEDQSDFKDLSSNALQKGRFGCWTCTVVRKDKAVQNLITNGHTSLVPLLDFRNWIYIIRDNHEYRCKHRRNGAKGPGPFTLEARELILRKLIKAQTDSGYTLITDSEIEFIRSLWYQDKMDKKYTEK
jgi:DNA sulfur modification protein DndC